MSMSVVVVSRYSVTYFCIMLSNVKGGALTHLIDGTKSCTCVYKPNMSPPPPTLIVQCGMVVKIVTKFPKFLARIAAYKTDTILIAYGAP